MAGRSISQVMASRFFLIGILLPSIGNANSEICSNDSLRLIFDSELNISEQQNACKQSETAKYAQIEIEVGRKQSIKVQCCDAIRIKMEDAAGKHLKLKELLCSQAPGLTKKISCAGANGCLEKSIDLLDTGKVIESRLAENAEKIENEMKRIADECGIKMNEMRRSVAGDTFAIKDAYGRAQTKAERDRISKAPFLRRQ